MKFDEFQRGIDQITAGSVVGDYAHSLIFPEITRFRQESLLKNPNPKLSAVAAIVFPDKEEANLLLIERQTYDGAHSGQIGFPGGKMEMFDASLEDTARRETEEEVGISGHIPILIKELSQVYIPPSGYLVHPFLFLIDSLPELALDPREVQSIVKLPVRRLMEDQTLVEGNIPTSQGTSIRTKYFEHSNKKIWGATAMMLAELKILLQQTHDL